MEGGELRLTTEQEVSRNDEEDNLEEVCNSVLPDDLVQRIVAMVPFPYIFKARALSKSWLARFEPVDSRDDQGKKDSATYFQKKVSEWSSNWKTLCPVFFDPREGLVAYDSTSQSCPRMLSLSFIPERLRCCRVMQINGALLLLTGCNPDARARLQSFTSSTISHEQHHPGPLFDDHQLTVANCFTRRWKQLPSLPPSKDYQVTEILLSQPSLGTYKVIVFFSTKGHTQSCEYAQIYDSASNAWKRSKPFVAHNITGRIDSPKYFNGVVYLLGDSPKDILAFDVEEECSQHLHLSGDVTPRKPTSLVIWDASLLMIVQGPTETCHRDLRLWKIDLRSRKLLYMASDTLAESNFCLYPVYGSEDGCIYFRFVDPSSCPEFKNALAVYNVYEDKFKYISCPTPVRSRISRDTNPEEINHLCQPSLNPFLAV